jgi:hypothetical protein
VHKSTCMKSIAARVRLHHPRLPREMDSSPADAVGASLAYLDNLQGLGTLGPFRVTMCPAPVPSVAWLDDVQERDKSPACNCYCSTSTTATAEVRQSRWISRCVLEKFFRS